MSNIPLPDNAGRIDTFTRTEGADTVHMQAIVPVDPATGDPLQLAQEATLAALNTAVATLNTAATAIKTAVEALNTKTTAVNTGAIAGTVALDGATLAALESINAATGLAQPLTDAQLRAAAVPVSGTFYPATQPVSAAALPLPAGAATEATLAAVEAKLPELSGGRLPVELPAGGGSLTDSELRASAVAVTAAFVKAEDTPSASGDYGVVLLAQRRDTDATAVDADGDYATLKTDEAGRLKVATQPASYALVSGNITASGQNVACDVSRASNVVVMMTAASLAGHNCTFEGSLDSTNGTDGTWFALQAVRSNANTIENTTGVLAATPAYSWELSVNACNYFRIRATAHTSGTATWKIQRGTYATEPIPAAQISGTQPVSGSVTATLAAATVRAGFVAGAGIWYDDSATTLAASASFTGTSRDLTATATATAFANAATYAKELRVSAESDQAGTLWLEVSRDNTNWRRVKSVATTAVTGGGQYAEIVHRPSWRYARVGFTNGATPQTRFSIGSLLVAL